MRLTVKSVLESDFGSYRCVSKNSLGDTEGTIKLYGMYPVYSIAIYKYYTKRCWEISGRNKKKYIYGNEIAKSISKNGART